MMKMNIHVGVVIHRYISRIVQELLFFCATDDNNGSSDFALSSNENAGYQIHCFDGHQFKSVGVSILENASMRDPICSVDISNENGLLREAACEYSLLDISNPTLLASSTPQAKPNHTTVKTNHATVDTLNGCDNFDRSLLDISNRNSDCSTSPSLVNDGDGNENVSIKVRVYILAYHALFLSLLMLTHNGPLHSIQGRTVTYSCYDSIMFSISCRTRKVSKILLNRTFSVEACSYIINSTVNWRKNCRTFLQGG